VNVPKSIHNAIYKDLIVGLTQARLEADLTQQVIADRLGKPQSFIAKIEGLERRIDIVEFFEIAKAIGFDPVPLIKEIWEQVEAE